MLKQKYVFLLMLAVFAMYSQGCLNSAAEYSPSLITMIDSPSSDAVILTEGTVYFEASANGGTPPFEYEWDFDGGAPLSTLEDPGNVIFDIPGSYTVILTITDSEGAAAQSTVIVEVKNIIAEIELPSSESITIYEGESINFQGDYQGGLGPFVFEWNFDGAVPSNSTAEDPGNVQFDSRRPYNVAFTVTDAAMDTDSDLVTVTVEKAVTSIEISPSSVSLPPDTSMVFTITATYSDMSTGDVTSETEFSSDNLSVEMNGATAAIPIGAEEGLATITASYTRGTTTEIDFAEITILPSGKSKAEIKAYWSSISPVSSSVSYSFSPVLSVGDDAYEGEIDSQSIMDGINKVNFYRWLAGLPDDVTEDATYRVRSQKGAHVLAMLEINGESPSDPHHPELPTGATSLYETNIYNDGYNACSSSNIFRGWGGDPFTPAETVDGYMDDFGNDETLGHRRWILFPTFNKTAFGTVWGSGVWASCMYIGYSGPEPEYDYVAYPSQGNYPLQAFTGSTALWSFSVNDNKYNFDGNTSVTVIRKSDRQDLQVTTNDALPFYGITPTIRFDPGEAVKDETYIVTIENIWDNNLIRYFNYVYAVTFFDAEE